MISLTRSAGDRNGGLGTRGLITQFASGDRARGLNKGAQNLFVRQIVPDWEIGGIAARVAALIASDHIEIALNIGPILVGIGLALNPSSLEMPGALLPFDVGLAFLVTL